MERIKTLSQRLRDGTFSAPYPLGAEGLNVDMLSGNNLEEEFHLGGSVITTFGIDEENKIFTITEEYRKEDQTDEFYVMKTRFETIDDSGAVIQDLYFSKNGELKLKKTKTVTFYGEESYDFRIKEIIT